MQKNKKKRKARERAKGTSSKSAEFQRTAGRDKKAFFNEQCLIIEEDNKRGKTRDLLRKTGNIKGAFHPKIGTIKDKNGRYIVDAEEIKKR